MLDVNAVGRLPLAMSCLGDHSPPSSAPPFPELILSIFTCPFTWSSPLVARFALAGFLQAAGSLPRSPHAQGPCQVTPPPVYGRFDPVFWLHHCNLDRIYQRYITENADSAEEMCATQQYLQQHKNEPNRFEEPLEPFAHPCTGELAVPSDAFGDTEALHYCYDELPEAQPSPPGGAPPILAMFKDIKVQNIPEVRLWAGGPSPPLPDLCETPAETGGFQGSRAGVLWESGPSDKRFMDVRKSPLASAAGWHVVASQRALIVAFARSVFVPCPGALLRAPPVCLQGLLAEHFAERGRARALCQRRG